jgi:mannosyl-3-phosphoglycerate phosphatase
MLIIFTDLDSTLLEHHTYSFKEAEESLNLIKEKKIPLIFCSSKTRFEIEVWRRKLKNSHPFISENGGAIFIPKNYFSYNFKYTKLKSWYKVIELGTDYGFLIETIKNISKRLKIPIEIFSEMPVKRIIDITGLSKNDVKLSKRREYDEPFLVNENFVSVMKREVRKYGLRIVRGGRFWHLIGNNDKGKAVKIITKIFKKNYPNEKVVTVGIGDSLNDLPMLKQTDIPVIVQKVDSSYENKIKLSNLVKAEYPGPEGWNEVVKKILLG